MTTVNTMSGLLKDDTNLDCQMISYASDEDTSMTGCLEDISINLSNEFSLSEGNSIANGSNRVTSTNQMKVLQDERSCEKSSSIAVQTLSTGDIMATQIFHDMS